MLLDGVFGPRNFRNEIIWKRTSAHNSARRFGPVHDTIFFYTKSEDYTWRPAFQPLPQETADQRYNNVEPQTGRPFNRADLTAAGTHKGPSGSPWRGIDPTDKGRHWAIPGFVGDLVRGKDTLDALDALDAAGRIHWPKRVGGTPMLKRYLDEARGIAAQDVITDISPLNNVAVERLGYPTQKPEALLERIIVASSSAGKTVLDPFCGCGTAVDGFGESLQAGGDSPDVPTVGALTGRVSAGAIVYALIEWKMWCRAGRAPADAACCGTTGKVAYKNRAVYGCRRS
jgi:site-specific DNA-methyltransferase (adenine-specific)